MKKTILFVALILSVSHIWAQDETIEMRLKAIKDGRDFRIPQLGEVAPSFTAQSTTGEINFPSDYGRNWKVLFSHPQDFTPVCTSEILELTNLQSEFEKMGVKIVVISTDPLHQHLEWKNAMKDMQFKGRTDIDIRFPLVDDESLMIAKKYGMIHPASNSTKNVRGIFIIDPDNVIRIVSFYPMEVGRSTEEILRSITAIQTADRNGVLTPADWRAGNDVLVPVPPKTNTSGSLPEGYYQLAWFMWYKKDTK
jgi:peroxiredoxin (alkyl hydroperoxide reductase subunit C)